MHKSLSRSTCVHESTTLWSCMFGAACEQRARPHLHTLSGHKLHFGTRGVFRADLVCGLLDLRALPVDEGALLLHQRPGLPVDKWKHINCMHLRLWLASLASAILMPCGTCMQLSFCFAIVKAAWRPRVPSFLRICPHMQCATCAKHNVHKLTGSWLDTEMSKPHVFWQVLKQRRGLTCSGRSPWCTWRAQ
jgi:hypothetical protein